MTMTTVAVQLTGKRVQQLRDLIADMRDHGEEGLVDRAHAVGYSRESMHLQPNDAGALLLIHLTHEGDFESLQQGIIAYPETDFTRWWVPRWIEIVGGALPRPELLFSFDGVMQP